MIGHLESLEKSEKWFVICLDDWVKECGEGGVGAGVRGVDTYARVQVLDAWEKSKNITEKTKVKMLSILKKYFLLPTRMHLWTNEDNSVKLTRGDFLLSDFQ